MIQGGFFYVWYDPKARCPDFEMFIASVMQGDQQLIEYLKRALGYSISGGAFQVCFFITYVSCNEPPDGMVLNSALIKTLSGNDRITARYLYENSFEFVASFKLWFNSKHLSAITDDSVFKSGRVHLIPFNRHALEGGLEVPEIIRQEVTIGFNAAEGAAEIYTADPVWIWKMDKLVQQNPEQFKMGREETYQGEFIG